jgi:hypothetical protein
MKKTKREKTPAALPIPKNKKPVAGRTAQKSRKAASVKDGFNAVWIDLLPRLSARFKNPEVFREAYQRLFLMGFKPALAPEDKDEFDLCNVLCGNWEVEADPLEGHYAPGTKSKPKVRKARFTRKAKPLPIQVSFEPMHNDNRKNGQPFYLNPTFTYPSKDWIEGIRKVKTIGPKKTPAVFWLKALAEEENRKARKKPLPVSIPDDEPNDELRLALLALEFDCRAELGDLCQRALTDSDPQAFQRLERFCQAVRRLRAKLSEDQEECVKLTKDQWERIIQARRFIECFERLCFEKGFPPTKGELREACGFDVPGFREGERKPMDEVQFRNDFINKYGLHWLPTEDRWGKPRKRC